MDRVEKNIAELAAAIKAIETKFYVFTNFVTKLLGKSAQGLAPPPSSSSSSSLRACDSVFHQITNETELYEFERKLSEDHFKNELLSHVARHQRAPRHISIPLAC